MSPLVECLRCGARHRLHRALRQLDESQCPRCGYLGWTPLPQAAGAAPHVRRPRPDEPPARHAFD